MSETIKNESVFTPEECEVLSVSLYLNFGHRHPADIFDVEFSGSLADLKDPDEAYGNCGVASATFSALALEDASIVRVGTWRWENDDAGLQHEASIITIMKGGRPVDLVVDWTWNQFADPNKVGELSSHYPLVLPVDEYYQL